MSAPGPAAMSAPGPPKPVGAGGPVAAAGAQQQQQLGLAGGGQSGKDVDQLKVCTEAVEGLLVSLEGLVTQSKNFSSPADSSAQVSMQWQVEKMTHSSEKLLQLISNLKVSAVFNDMAAMNARVDARDKELREAEVVRQKALVSLGLEVADLLHELETHYYATQ